MTFGKSLQKSSKWHQAELIRSIPVDFRAKRVKTFTSIKRRKYAKTGRKKLTCFFFFHFLLAYRDIIILKSVIIGKSFKKSALCRQADFFSSNCLAFTWKWIYLGPKVSKKKIIKKIKGLVVQNCSKILHLCLPKWLQVIFGTKKA